jgi:hypothetical protein
LAWDLEWGSKEKLDFLKTLQQQGVEPFALKNKPKLVPWAVEYYRAFHTLSSSRPMGMGGVGPIPISEVLAYFEVFEVRDPDERETYVTMIQALDSVYLQKQSERSGSGAKSKPAGDRK